MDKELEELFEASKRKLGSMTLEEREAMYDAQRERYVRAELSWPKPKFELIDGVKIYASYEDYCND